MVYTQICCRFYLFINLGSAVAFTAIVCIQIYCRFYLFLNLGSAVAFPAMVYTKMYCRFYLFINLGSAVAFTAMVYIQQDISFALGYFIPAMFMVVAVVIFVAARRKYVQHVPGGESGRYALANLNRMSPISYFIIIK